MFLEKKIYDLNLTKSDIFENLFEFIYKCISLSP